MQNTAIVILAAGQAQRFGSAKQLADFCGKPLLQQVVDNCLDTDLTDLYLVLGAYKQRIEAALNLQQVHILTNREWVEGIASSIRTAVEALAEEVDSILFVAGDQPQVSSGDIRELINLGNAHPGRICCASYRSSPGIPALFPRSCFAELLRLRGDQGAKQILFANRSQLFELVMPSAAIDIDYQADIHCSSL